jgi:2-polyprenyl-3-methyl-5-hydroxy-6-metoxy-1,4-benzoquinol methylase
MTDRLQDLHNLQTATIKKTDGCTMPSAEGEKDLIEIMQQSANINKAYTCIRVTNQKRCVLEPIGLRGASRTYTLQDRLDIYHKLFMVARRDQLHQAPIPRIEPRILDLGCGTGIWAIDMAE